MLKQILHNKSGDRETQRYQSKIIAYFAYFDTQTGILHNKSGNKET